MNAERQFAIWGWGIVIAAALFDLILVHDTFFTRPEEYGIITTWKAAPWYVVLFLGVPLAHIWLLALIWQALWGSRAIWRRARLLAVALLISILVFQALMWDSGERVKRIISSNEGGNATRRVASLSRR